MEGSGEKPNYDRAKNCALALLEEFCIDSAPVEPAKIARNLGITVNFAQFDNKFNNVSGFYNIDQNAIYVNIKENFPRMTFTIAHELGHQQLHRDSIKNGDYKVLYRDQNLNSKDPKEQEANFFAANFLVPRFLLEKYSVKKLLELELTSISELATVFAVSPQVIKYRLRNEYRI